MFILGEDLEPEAETAGWTRQASHGPLIGDVLSTNAATLPLPLPLPPFTVYEFHAFLYLLSTKTFNSGRGTFRAGSHLTVTLHFS